MKKFFNYILLFISHIIIAQETDFKSWSAVEYDMKINNDFTIDLSQHFRLKDDLNSVDSYITEADLSLETKNNITFSTQFRYYIKNDNKGGIQGFENLFRYRIGVEKKIKLKPFNIEFRAAYQNRFSLERDNKFKKRLRLRPTVEYKIKDWSNNPKIYFEYLKELEGSNEQSFRYGIASKLNFDDLKSITIRYFFQKSKIDLGSTSNWHVISLKYSFSKDI